MHLESAVALSNAAGIYSWNVQKNVLFGDARLAEVFGLEPKDAYAGLPIERYLERVHPSDRPRLTAAIGAAVTSNQPFQSEYRVLNRDGAYRWILAVGQCFHDGQGEPIEYAGMVFDVTQQKLEPVLLLLYQCSVALSLAENIGDEVSVSLLRRVVGEIEMRYRPQLN